MVMMPLIRFVCWTVAGFLLGFPPPACGQGPAVRDSVNHGPGRAYVVLRGAPFPVHHVRADCSGEGFLFVAPMRVEVLNLLVPPAVWRGWAAPPPGVWGPADTLLVVFSVLPDARGAVHWDRLAPDTLPTDQLLPLRALVRAGAAAVAVSLRPGASLDHELTTSERLVPVVYRHGAYWAPRSGVLTQYVRVRTRAARRLAWPDYATLDVGRPRVDRDAPWRTIRALLPADAPYPFRRFLPPLGLAVQEALGGVYTCWSRPEQTTSHPGARLSGLGTFDYRPGVGVLHGTYPGYLSLLGWHHVFFDRVAVDDTTRLH